MVVDAIPSSSDFAADPQVSTWSVCRLYSILRQTFTHIMCTARVSSHLHHPAKLPAVRAMHTLPAVQLVLRGPLGLRARTSRFGTWLWWALAWQDRRLRIHRGRCAVPLQASMTMRKHGKLKRVLAQTCQYTVATSMRRSEACTVRDLALSASQGTSDRFAGRQVRACAGEEFRAA
jgi:hypothetical protein